VLWPLAGIGSGPQWLVTALVVLDLVIRVVALGVVPGNRRPTTAMAWLLGIFFIPVVFLLLFLMFGSTQLSQRRILKQSRINQRIMDSIPDLHDAESSYHGPPWVDSAAQLNRALGSFPLLDGNRVELYRNYSASMDAMARSVRGAQDFVHVEFYIMSYDAVTRDLFDALRDAAERGVRVRVLYDHIGTLRIRGYRQLVRFLQESSIEWHRMLPVRPERRRWRRPDLRNHRKILVVDGRVAFTGSQNLIEPSYNNKAHRRRGRQWVELMCRLEGPIVTALNSVFATDWYAESDETLESELNVHAERVRDGGVTCQVVPSGPGFATENNLRLFNTLIYSASRRISICSPYFVPDDSLLYAVTTAAQRGVDVELFVSEKGDQLLVEHAQRSYYQGLLEAGVRIYLYPEPSTLHAKHFTVDDQVAVLGSSNMDMRSFSLNLEVSLMMLGRPIVEQMREVEDFYRNISRELTLQDWARRPLPQRYLDNVARLTATLQ
jgi:cardiolipin synthase